MTLDDRGFVQFDETLRSVSHPDVFVAGESADMGTALTDNVAAFCGDAPAPRYRRYQPPTRQLTLLDCGDGSALLAYGGVAREGRMAMRLKESLDRRFMSRLSAARGRHVELAAGGPELRRLLRHSLLHVLPPRLIPQFVRQLHRTELRAAHRAEVRHLGAVGRQRLVVVGPRRHRDRAPG